FLNTEVVERPLRPAFLQQLVDRLPGPHAVEFRERVADPWLLPVVTAARRDAGRIGHQDLADQLPAVDQRGIATPDLPVIEARRSVAAGRDCERLPANPAQAGNASLIAGMARRRDFQVRPAVD